MRDDSEAVLNRAIRAITAADPDAMQVAAAGDRVARRLGLDPVSRAQGSSMESIADVPSYPSEAAKADWSKPKRMQAFHWRPSVVRWSMVPTLAALMLATFLYKAFWRVPPGVRAEVQSIDGLAYLVSEGRDAPLAAGDSLQESDRVRTSGGAHAVLRISDGSMVEVNERSVLDVKARGRNMTISLADGAVIVQAAKRTSGHLYVKTPDCRVAVTGTVFSVNAGIKGSRIAVLKGTVHVMHTGIDSLVQAGGQMTTSENLSQEPVSQQIAWSHNFETYLPLLAQFSALQRKIDDLPGPQLRYTSDLLGRMPANTLLYVSIPNLGNFLSQANDIFHDQLQQSPALQQWWNRGTGNKTAELDATIQKLHQMSEYLGDEIVVAGLEQADHPGFAVVADVTKNGLGDFLKNQIPVSGQGSAFTVFDQASLAAASEAPKTPGGYALVRQHEVVFSNNVALLRQINEHLNAGASGFATGEFGAQIAAAYGRGAGVILAADVHQMMQQKVVAQHLDSSRSRLLTSSGMEGFRYLIAEHREKNGLPENHVNLQFAGTRQGVASWLAAPAPIGSLEFVTPNAALAIGVLSKDPTAIAEDIMAMALKSGPQSESNLSDAEAKLHISIRNDLAANLGGDFLISLDGPVLPTPSWKAVVEVRNSDRFEKTLEQLAESFRNLSDRKSHAVDIQSSEVGGQKFYAVRDVASGSTLATYTFADGYMILGPDRALLMQALRTHATGDSLARSAAFKALLPRDENANYSAIAYQNISPVLTPLLSTFTGEAANALQQMASDARPTAVCAWGRDSRIEAASNSHLFGFDFVALEALLHSLHTPGNTAAGGSVRD